MEILIRIQKRTEYTIIYEYSLKIFTFFDSMGMCFERMQMQEHSHGRMGA